MRFPWNCLFFQDNRTQEQSDRREKLSDNQFQYLNMIVIFNLYILNDDNKKKAKGIFRQLVIIP